MAKKKHKKKHNFQHKNAPKPVAAAAAASNDVSGGTALKSNAMPNEWAEVAGDVRRALILAGVFIGLMIVLWYFLDVSQFGKNLYNSIKL